MFSTLNLNHQVKEKIYSVYFRKAIILNTTCEYDERPFLPEFLNYTKFEGLIKINFYKICDAG